MPSTPSSSSSIVNTLIRAAAAIPQDISDADLDKHVADLLAREAKEKEVKWREFGLSAYLEGEGRGGDDRCVHDSGWSAAHHEKGCNRLITPMDRFSSQIQLLPRTKENQ